MHSETRIKSHLQLVHEIIAIGTQNYCKARERNLSQYLITGRIQPTNDTLTCRFYLSYTHLCHQAILVPCFVQIPQLWAYFPSNAKLLWWRRWERIWTDVWRKKWSCVISGPWLSMPYSDWAPPWMRHASIACFGGRRDWWGLCLQAMCHQPCILNCARTNLSLYWICHCMHLPSSWATFAANLQSLEAISAMLSMVLGLTPMTFISKHSPFKLSSRDHQPNVNSQQSLVWPTPSWLSPCRCWGR